MFHDSSVTQKPCLWHDSSQSNAHEASWFHDYDVRILPQTDSESYGIFISSEFSNPNDNVYKGMFYHEEDGLMSIELNTHNESLIAEAVSLCKTISENFCMLDDLLRSF